MVKMAEFRKSWNTFCCTRKVYAFMSLRHLAGCQILFTDQRNGEGQWNVLSRSCNYLSQICI